VTANDDSKATTDVRQPKPDPVRRGSNGGVVLSCVAALLVMGGATWAAVPLYRLFCQVTGYGGTTMRAEKAPDAVLDRTITVRFDSNVAPGMKWEFGPAQRTMEVKVGENALAFYKAHNSAPNTLKGTATYNVSPEIVGSYFNKIECFCFTEQTLQPGESIEMPLTFFVDPAILQNAQAARIDHITLSYTFYPTEPAAQPAKGQAAVTGTQTKSGS